jgi:hypothetical protein
MRPSMQQIKDAIKGEGDKHAIKPDSFRLDLPPLLESNACRFHHECLCVCGFKFSFSAHYSVTCTVGQAEFASDLREGLAEHLQNALAGAIDKLLGPITEG